MDELRLPRDPQGIDEPHDVLAADEFAMPAHGDLPRQRQLALPDDPTGIAEAHDVLAAEDFAMPAGPDEFAEKTKRGGPVNRFVVVGAAALAALLALAARRRR
jgi:MYXO-CTERM domain-containing protein